MSYTTVKTVECKEHEERKHEFILTSSVRGRPSKAAPLMFLVGNRGLHFVYRPSGPLLLLLVQDVVRPVEAYLRGSKKVVVSLAKKESGRIDYFHSPLQTKHDNTAKRDSLQVELALKHIMSPSQQYYSGICMASVYSQNDKLVCEFYHR